MRNVIQILSLTIVFCAVAGRTDWTDFRGPWLDGGAVLEGSSNVIGLPLHWSETGNVKCVRC
jgi:hypothetical protein